MARLDHLGVLFSLAYRLVRCLSGLLAVLVRSDLSNDAEMLVLRRENRCYAASARPGAVGPCRPTLAYGAVPAG